MMKWSEIRQLHPSTWLLVEAVKAHTIEDKRILDDIAVLNGFEDGQIAWHAYTQLHRAEPHRKMLVLHSDRPEIELQIKHLVSPRHISLPQHQNG